ncbi:MAG TPA: AraC family transcriptional regulator [Chondromyces sp.]|nr:AraC family transcriptional regulator [Chondromyces sp.]
MGIVSQVLRSVRLSGGVFFHAEFSAPFCVESPTCGHIADILGLGSRRVVPFHIVKGGSCEARIAGRDPIPLEADDVVVFFHGGTHEVASPGATRRVPIAPLLPPPPYHGRIQDVSHGGGGAVTTMMCGFLHHEPVVFNPLFWGLPEVIAVSGRERDHTRRLHRILQDIEDEARVMRPGSECLMARLTELLFIEVLRTYMARVPDGGSHWLRGIRDPFVSRALQLIHEQPARDWSLAELGREVGRSRSALSERFSEIVGVPPMQYLARWRMQLAAQLLLDSEATVAGVGARVGYGSEAAFNRAFRRVVGMPPAAWRREHSRPSSHPAAAAPPLVSGAGAEGLPIRV